MQQPVDVLAECLECIKHYLCVDLKEYDLLKGKKIKHLNVFLMSLVQIYHLMT